MSMGSTSVDLASGRPFKKRMDISLQLGQAIHGLNVFERPPAR